MLDLGAGKVAYCTISINNVPVTVGVVYDAKTDKLSLAQASFYEFDRLEQLEKASLLSDYSISADVHCPGARYQLIPVGTILTCSVTGSPGVASLRLRAEPNGNVFTFNPSGTTSPAWITDALKVHAAGNQTILDGAVVARWDQDALKNSMIAGGNPATTVSVTCPEKLDLSGTNHAVCTVLLSGLTMHREVFIDPVKGLDARSMDAAIDQQKVQRMAQDDLNARLQQNGLQADAVVHCSSGLIVVTPPGVFYCDATAGGKTYKLEVSVEDAKGTVRWRAVSPDEVHPQASGSPKERAF
jgi:hypothetical protein